MDRLATLLPEVRLVRWVPLSRDQAMLLMVAVNEIFLGIDTYLAHDISGTIVPREWIPILFGPVAGLVLLAATLLWLRRRMPAALLITLVLLASAVVGFLGTYFHLIRAALPSGPEGKQLTLNLLVWAPPVLGPLTFDLVALLGISAAWQEDPVDSGRLALPLGKRVQMPVSKTRALLMAVGLGTLATVASSVLDHARTGFENQWLWAPTGLGVFGTVVAVLVGAQARPSRRDLATFVAAMLALIVVGLIGAVLHALDNLGAQQIYVTERFVRGAPVLAPLLFCNMGALGLIVLLDPVERPGRWARLLARR